MKRKKAAFFITSIYFIMIIPGLCVSADTQARNTRSEVDFEAGTGPVDPLDPDFPDIGLTNPNDAVTTSDNGSLSLNVVPGLVFAQEDGLGFTANLIGGGVYGLYSPERPYVQVSDLRGTGGGWKLTVSASPLEGEGLPELKGAEIRLLGGNAHSSNPALTPVLTENQVIIECGADRDVTVAEAANGNGMGAWIMRWYSGGAGVELYIPPETAVISGKYTTTLYWTLQNAE